MYLLQLLILITDQYSIYVCSQKSENRGKYLKKKVYEIKNNQNVYLSCYRPVGSGVGLPNDFVKFNFHIQDMSFCRSPTYNSAPPNISVAHRIWIDFRRPCVLIFLSISIMNLTLSFLVTSIYFTRSIFLSCIIPKCPKY